MNNVARVSALCAMALPFVASAREIKADVLKAMHNGAMAEVCLKVLDDSGEPVTNASVRAVFDILPEPRSFYGRTDTNGVCVVRGMTNGNYIEFRVGKKGYYGSTKRITYIQMHAEHDVSDGKWQPYGSEQQILLRPVKAPLRLISESAIEYKFTRQLGAWIGFDVEKHDFVAPHGKGEKSDFDVYLDWDGKRFPDCKKIGLKIRFAQPYSGYYEIPINSESELTTPYNATPGNEYFQSAELYDIYDGKRIRQTFDKSKCWVVRSRCRIDDNGRLIAANYTVVRFTGISGSRDGMAGFCFLSAFNPTPNDTNLEDEEIAKQSRHFIRQCEPQRQ